MRHSGPLSLRCAIVNMAFPMTYPANTVGKMTDSANGTMKNTPKPTELELRMSAIDPKRTLLISFL